MRNLFESVIRESIRIANAITVRIWKILLRWRLPIPPWLQLRALSPIGKVKYVLETAEDATRVLSLGTKEPTTLRMIQLVRDGDLVVFVLGGKPRFGEQDNMGIIRGRQFRQLGHLTG